VWLFARGRRIPIAIAATAVASPWLILSTMRSGSAFWNDFFWHQQVDRFFAPAFHPQPIWYYIPILLAGLFPWTPLAFLLPRKAVYADARIRSLGWWLLYGFLFFSVSRNGLPAYVLPLMPALAILLAVALEKASAVQWWVGACSVLLI